jgi:hypothetical protein
MDADKPVQVPSPVAHAIACFLAVVQCRREGYVGATTSFWKYLAGGASLDFNKVFWDAHPKTTKRVSIGRFTCVRNNEDAAPFNICLKVMILNHAALSRLLSTTGRDNKENTRDFSSIRSLSYTPTTDVVGVVIEKSNIPSKKALSRLKDDAPSIASLRRGAIFTEDDLKRTPLFTDDTQCRDTLKLCVDCGRNGATASIYLEKDFNSKTGVATHWMVHKFFSSGYFREVSGQFVTQQYAAQARWANTWGDLDAIHKTAAARARAIFRARSTDADGALDMSADAQVPDDAKNIFVSLHAFYSRGQNHRAISFMVTWLFHLAANLFLAHRPKGKLSDMNVVVLWGDADQHTQSKLKGPAFPCQQLLAELARYFPILRVDEYFSSQTCPTCGNNWGKESVKHNANGCTNSNQRFVTCKHCTVVDQDGVSHQRTYDKDITAGQVSQEG